jgi:nucleoside-diphosphate-sugar epimerase
VSDVHWGWGVADADADRCVGVLGASSFVGGCLLPLLAKDGWNVTAFSRSATDKPHCDGVTWQQLPLTASTTAAELSCGNLKTTPYWICVAPIWVLPEYFALLDGQGARRVVVLSSTSRFTKDGSSDPQEQAIALRLIEAEAQVQAWAQSRGVEWVILRPTLIYGLGRDKNISEITRFIRRFGFFPLFGKANGLRQPVHAADVASACVAALQAPGAANRAYNLSGAETLPYHTMVGRVFEALGKPARLLAIPLWVFTCAIAMLRLLPRYRHWSAAMAERMNQDLVFDHTDATRDFGFGPRGFEMRAEDIAAPAKQT